MFDSPIAALRRGIAAQPKRRASRGVEDAILLNSACIDGQLIDYVVDRNRHKHGKFMPGVHLPIYDTAKLLESPAPDYVLLRAWNFKDEVMRQQQEYGTRGGRFIVAIPMPEIAAS